MNCASPLSASEWSTAFRRKAVALRLPVSGVLELTSRCNLDCAHCYLGPRHGREERRREEMSTSQVFDVIDQICEAGCLYLVITGGDPMVRRDFPDIYRYAREKGLIVTVFSNGVLVSDTIVSLFHDYPPFKVDISIYGATAGTYERVTRTPGSFQAFLAGVKRLAAAKIPFSLKTVVTALNKHEIGQMRVLAYELGAQSFRVDPALFPRLSGRDRGAPLQLRVDPAEAVALEMNDPASIEEWATYARDRRDLPDTDKLYVCGAGVTDFYIDPYGYASPCVMTTHDRFPITPERGFKDLWSDELSRILKRTVGRDFACRTCGMRTVCTGCPAFNQLETGREDVPPAYVCELARHRLRVINEYQDRQGREPVDFQVALAIRGENKSGNVQQETVAR